MSHTRELAGSPSRTSSSNATPTIAMPLAELRPGQSGRVLSIAGDLDFRQRLLELGLTPESGVRVVRSAPLGDPIEVEVRGYRLSLRRAEAITVLVQTDEHPGSTRSDASVDAEHPRARVRRRMTGPQAPVTAANSAPHYRIAVAGNPNTGKTTLFNALTRSRARVGNYPGITVDRRVGRCKLAHEREAEIVDIPGTYSLTARSREEQLALDEMLGRAGGRAPDALLVLLNATALTRSLYLLSQVLEFGLPTIAVLNMVDEAEAQGLRIDSDKLEQHFGVPFVPVVARSGRGVDQLKAKLGQLLAGQIGQPPHDHWLWEPSPALAAAIEQLGQSIGQLEGVIADPAQRRAFALWCLMSLREHDPFSGIPEQLREATTKQQQLLQAGGHDLDLEVVESRYRHVDQLVPQFVRRDEAIASKDVTARIDAVLTHPAAGMLVLVAVMGLIFTAIFDWAAPLMDAIEALFGALSEGLTRVLPAGLLTDLLVDGLLTGVGSVVVFLPQIVILFFFITLLEGTGYMSRAAFMMDRLMRKLGLQGKAFVPLVSGYACAIPAVMATRTLENHRDRLLTMMVIPLVSCSARLPIYTLIIGTLFAAEQAVLGPISLGTLMMLALYLLSMLLTLIAAAVIGRTVVRGRPQPLLIELPPYRLPSVSTVALVLWQKAKLFLHTAGTVIVVISIVLWVLLSFPRNATVERSYEQAVATAVAAGDGARVERLRAQHRASQLEQSYAGQIGRFLEPLIAPLGFDWKIGIGLVGSFAAREVFVATMGMVYGVGEADDTSGSLREAIRQQRRSDGSPVYTPLTGLSLLVFYMLALQCMSTIAVVRQESGSWKWTGFMLAYLTALAYLGSLTVYQVGRFLGFS
jgi:ferrous iron transport protein B